MPGSHWVGLESLTLEIGVPVQSQRHNLFVMAFGFDQKPQMFMTDQF